MASHCEHIIPTIHVCMHLNVIINNYHSLLISRKGMYSVFVWICVMTYGAVGTSGLLLSSKHN